jgi:hypothetical protein
MKFYTIYYQTKESFRTVDFYLHDPDKECKGSVETVLNGETHVELMTIPIDGRDEGDLDAVYWKMQGENWSPNGEARSFIRRKGLGHTSMSMGDCVLDNDTGEVYLVTGVGFKKLN